jgi:hypothetical protein
VLVLVESLTALTGFTGTLFFLAATGAAAINPNKHISGNRLFIFVYECKIRGKIKTYFEEKPLNACLFTLRRLNFRTFSENNRSSSE